MRHVLLVLALTVMFAPGARAATEWIPPENRTTQELKRFITMYEQKIDLAERRIAEKSLVTYHTRRTQDFMLATEYQQEKIRGYAWKLKEAKAELAKRGESLQGFIPQWKRTGHRGSAEYETLKAAVLRKGNVQRRVAQH
jgi:hypothetical protein